MARNPTRLSLPTALISIGLFASCGQGSVGDATNSNASGALTGDAGSPNVVLFVIDTLRADRLGIYGNANQPSPNLDKFAREGVLFERAWAPSPYTATSHASLFTSTYPATHGIWNRQRLESKDGDVYPALPPSAVTLAEVMRDSGWQTTAIAGGGYVNERRGLAQGFDYFNSQTLGVVNRIDHAIDWLNQMREVEKPFFMFLHTYEVHYPYLPDEEHINRFDSEYVGPLRDAVAAARIFVDDYMAKNPNKSPIGPAQKKFFKPIFDGNDFSDRDKEFVFALYDAEISIVDEQFARFMVELERLGLADNTIIIITSDHGEELWDHGYFGHHRVWDEVMHIPMLIKLPGHHGGVRRQDSIDLVDLMPSLLAELGLDLPDCAVGKAVNFRRPPTEIEERVHVHQANWPQARQAWRKGDYKVHFFPDEGLAPQSYDLSVDPNELTNTANSAWISAATSDLNDFWQRSDQLREDCGLFPVFHSLGSFTPEMREELAGLGYIQDDEE